MYFEDLLESNFQLIIPFPIENVGNLQGHFELKINKIQKLEYIAFITITYFHSHFCKSIKLNMIPRMRRKTDHLSCYVEEWVMT